MIEATNQKNLSEKSPSIKEPLLTSYQLKSVFSFFGQRENGLPNPEPFSALGELLNSCEKLWLSDFINKIPADCQVSPRIFSLINYAKANGYIEAASILSKIADYVDLKIVTKDDLALNQFEELPPMVQFVIAQNGSNLFPQLVDFLSTGGVISVLIFKKPIPDYLEAVRQSGDERLSFIDRVTLAVSSPNDQLRRVAHSFIGVSLIPKEENTQQANPNHISKIINRRIDQEIEEEYAKLVLLKILLTDETKGIFYSMVALTAAAPLLYWLNHQGTDNFLAQILIKFIPPFLADVVTFYAQLRPWFKDKNGGLKEVLGSYKKSITTSLAATGSGSLLAEQVAKTQGDFLGSVIYSFIPFGVALLTTFDTFNILKKRFGKSDWETVKIMFQNNPAHLGIDIGALTTFATGIGILGLAHQFRNPLAIALIEGVEEHGLAALFTKLKIAWGYSHNFEIVLKRQINRWKERFMK